MISFGLDPPGLPSSSFKLHAHTVIFPDVDQEIPNKFDKSDQNLQLHILPDKSF